MVWGLFYLFAGGSALGQILSETGTAQFLAERLIPLAGGGGFVAVAVFSLLTLIVTQITSNTAAVAIMVPITISTFQGLDMNPVPFVYIVTTAANCGLVLAVVVGGPCHRRGLRREPANDADRGLRLTLVLWVVLLVLRLSGCALLARLRRGLSQEREPFHRAQHARRATLPYLADDGLTRFGVHGVGSHFVASISRRKCELVTNSWLRYSRVVHEGRHDEPLVAVGALKRSKYSVTVALSL